MDPLLLCFKFNYFPDIEMFNYILMLLGRLAGIFFLTSCAYTYNNFSLKNISPSLLSLFDALISKLCWSFSFFIICLFDHSFLMYIRIFRILICQMNLLEVFQLPIFLGGLRLFVTLLYILTAQKLCLKIVAESWYFIWMELIVQRAWRHVRSGSLMP